MISAFTGQQVRAAEAPLLASGGGAVLMQRAAYGLANAVVIELRRRGRRIYGSSVTVLAGKGNNGGDGLFAAAMLARRGMRATAVLTAGEAHPEGLAAFERTGGRVERLGPDDYEELAVLAAGADVVVDAILGTGASGGLRGPAAEFVACLAELRPSLVVACDVPSGVDADTGESHWPVLDADVTVTFGGAKAGLFADPGEGHAGRVQVVRIGIEDRLPAAALCRLEESDVAALLPAPDRRSHKYTRGVLGIAAGSERYPGAAVLCAQAAALAGVGMVRYRGSEPVSRQVIDRTPEAVWDPGGPGRVQAWLVGPGIDGREQLARAAEALSAAREAGLPAVVDAGGFQLIDGRCPDNWILTPHAGELAGLLAKYGHEAGRDEIEARPLYHVRLAAELTGATILLKGATTLVASPGGTLFSQSDGVPWMATAGSGDTLAGILGALFAQLAETAGSADGPFASTALAGEARWAAIGALAASLHGRAGSLASQGAPLTASAIAEAVPQVIRGLASGTKRARQA